MNISMRKLLRVKDVPSEKKRKKQPKAILTAALASSLLPKKEGKQDLAANKFTAIEDDAAVVLSAHQGPLSLNGLEQLSEGSAAALSKHGNSLFLNGLQSLSEASASSLAQHHDKLYLNGITEISELVAHALTAHMGDLMLNGIAELSDSAAGILSSHKGWIHLDGLCNFPNLPGHISLAHKLAGRHNGTLKLNCVRDLTAPILKILSTHKGCLELDGLEQLPVDSAKIIASRQQMTSLLGLKSIQKDSADELAKGYLNGIELSSDTEGSNYWFSKLYLKKHSSCSPDIGIFSQLEESEQDDLSIQNESELPFDKLKQYSFLQATSNLDEEDESWIESENELLNSAPNVTPHEREVYRRFMGWGEGSALSAAKVAKLYCMSLSAVRALCNRVEKCMSDMKRLKPEPFQCTPPSPLDCRPRDGQQIRHTEDILFLAFLLEGSQTTGWMEISQHPSGEMTCRSIAKPTEPAVKGQQYWRTKTLKSLILENDFWDVRRLRRRPDGCRLKIPRGLKLNFPVHRGSDPLLTSASWHEHFHSWTNHAGLLVKKGELLCPLCGPTVPITVSVSSGNWTWRMECGRRYDIRCCSGCLGAFKQVLTSMS